MHIVLEPTLGTAFEKTVLDVVVSKIAKEHASDVLSTHLEPIYSADQLNPILQQKVSKMAG